MSRCRLILTAVALAGLLSGCKNTLGFCVYDYDCGDTEVCGATKRCEPRVIPGAQACSASADCSDGRVCVNSFCRFAPSCMNISGPYTVWRSDLGDAGVGASVRLLQPLGACTVTTETVDGGSFIRVEGSLNATNVFTSTASGGGCSVEVAGDETLRATCTQTGGTFSYHLYAATSGANRFTPTRCSPGLVPCNGRRCDVVDAGVCLTPASDCPPNGLNIPQCSPTVAP